MKAGVLYPNLQIEASRDSSLLKTLFKYLAVSFIIIMTTTAPMLLTINKSCNRCAFNGISSGIALNVCCSFVFSVLYRTVRSLVIV